MKKHLPILTIIAALLLTTCSFTEKTQETACDTSGTTVEFVSKQWITPTFTLNYKLPYCWTGDGNADGLWLTDEESDNFVRVQTEALTKGEWKSSFVKSVELGAQEFRIYSNDPNDPDAQRIIQSLALDTSVEWGGWTLVPPQGMDWCEWSVPEEESILAFVPDNGNGRSEKLEECPGKPEPNLPIEVRVLSREEWKESRPSESASGGEYIFVEEGNEETTFGEYEWLEYELGGIKNGAFIDFAAKGLVITAQIEFKEQAEALLMSILTQQQ